MPDSFYETINRLCVKVSLTLHFSSARSFFVLAFAVAHKKFNQINVPFVFAVNEKRVHFERTTVQE